MKKIVSADHSGSNFRFEGTFTREKIDGVFETLRDACDPRTLECELACEELLENDRTVKYDPPNLSQVNEFQHKMTQNRSQVKELTCQTGDGRDLQLSITREQRGREFDVAATGDDGGIRRSFELDDMELGYKTDDTLETKFKVNGAISKLDIGTIKTLAKRI